MKYKYQYKYYKISVIEFLSFFSIILLSYSDICNITFNKNNGISYKDIYNLIKIIKKNF